jgi:polysaccharide pyruvyl transferase WcaK-like protein
MAGGYEDVERELAAPIVFLYGYYGCGNLGDELLLSAVASGILERWPRTRFRVRNLGPIDPEPRVRTAMVATGIEGIIAQPGRSRVLRVVAYLRAAFSQLKGCHCFVLGGGTLLAAKTGVASLALLGALVVMARLRGAKVVGLGLGAADLEKPVPRLLARLILALMSDIAVRDQGSLALLPAGGRARLTGDLVYGWWPPNLALAAYAGATEPRVIAVSLWSVVPANEAALLTAIAAALRERLSAGDRLRFVVLQDGDDASGGLSDRPAFARLQVALGPECAPMEIVQPGSDPVEIAEAFRDVWLHCGARFHGCVLASLLAIPSVGLASDPKVTSLCEHLGMPSIALSDLTVGRLSEALNAAVPLRVPADKIEGLRERAAANFAWFDAHRNDVL